MKKKVFRERRQKQLEELKNAKEVKARVTKKNTKKSDK